MVQNKKKGRSSKRSVAAAMQQAATVQTTQSGRRPPLHSMLEWNTVSECLFGIHGHIDAETLAACFDHDTDVDAILAIKGSDGQIVSRQWMVIDDGYWHDEQHLDVDTRTTRQLVEKLKKSVGHLLPEDQSALPEDQSSPLQLAGPAPCDCTSA